MATRTKFNTREWKLLSRVMVDSHQTSQYGGNEKTRSQLPQGRPFRSWIPLQSNMNSVKISRLSSFKVSSFQNLIQKESKLQTPLCTHESQSAKNYYMGVDVPVLWITTGMCRVCHDTTATVRVLYLCIASPGGRVNGE